MEPRHFLLYWPPATADAMLAGAEPLDHAANDQLGRVRNGDTVWFVTARDGRLFLIGRIHVDSRTDRAGAVARLGTEDVGEADHHVFSDAPRPIRNVDIAGVAERLSFLAADADRPVLGCGPVSVQQLQTIRELTAESARLLEGAEERSTPERPAFVAGRVYDRRRDIHAVYGGQQQGGIATPAGSPFVFLFTGPRGEQHGYRDGWDEHGVFVYTGEGQVGDMQFARGNHAVQGHVAEGKDLLLFESLGKGVGCRFLGRFTCGGWECRVAPDRTGKDRQAIVFHLFPDEQAVILADESDASEAGSLDDLRVRAIAAAQPVEAASADPVETRKRYYQRSALVRRYVLTRAKGVCEACGKPAPFKRLDGTPYLEAHHTRRVSDGGPDHPRFVGAVCPACHAWIHRGQGGKELNLTLQAYLERLEGTV